MSDDALEEGVLVQDGVQVAELTRVALADRSGDESKEAGVERWMAELLQANGKGPVLHGIGVLETITYRWRVTVDEIDTEFGPRPVLSGRVLANLGLASTVLMPPR
jgi:hypothetical protein